MAEAFTGWDVVGDANWEVVEGVIQASKGTGLLVTPMRTLKFRNIRIRTL